MVVHAIETADQINKLDVFNEHPLLRDAAILPTRPLEEFVNAIRLWIDNLLPGGVVWGNQRVGKTQAIRYLIANCEALLGSPIPTTLVSVWDPTPSNTTEKRFFEELLYALGYALVNSGTAAVKRRRTIDFMIERAQEMHEHRYLLFIDEAQWLARAQLRILMDLHNQLKIADIRLITILVGQPELLIMKNDLRSSRQKHLLGRFMTATHQFEGVIGKQDFRRMNRALDSGSEYPDGSGCSYTRYFIPKAFGSGWRLLKHSDSIWNVLIEACRSEGIRKFKELPMQPLTALLRWLLQSLAEIDDVNLELHRPLIEEAVYRVAISQIEDLVGRIED